jgi:hypothetical protein
VRARSRLYRPPRFLMLYILKIDYKIHADYDIISVIDSRCGIKKERPQPKEQPDAARPTDNIKTANY